MSSRMQIACMQYKPANSRTALPCRQLRFETVDLCACGVLGFLVSHKYGNSVPNYTTGYQTTNSYPQPAGCGVGRDEADVLEILERPK